MICAWCGALGKIIGLAYGPKRPKHVIVKCTKCHHEWQTVVNE